MNYSEKIRERLEAEEVDTLSFNDMQKALDILTKVKTHLVNQGESDAKVKAVLDTMGVIRQELVLVGDEMISAAGRAH